MEGGDFSERVQCNMTSDIKAGLIKVRGLCGGRKPRAGGCALPVC